MLREGDSFSGSRGGGNGGNQELGLPQLAGAGERRQPTTPNPMEHGGTPGLGCSWIGRERPSTAKVAKCAKKAAEKTLKTRRLAGEFGAAPESVGEEKPDDDGQNQGSVFCLEQVGGDAGDKDKKEGQGDELEAESLVVWGAESEEETGERDQQRGGVAEVASARPGKVDSQGGRERPHQGGAALAELGEEFAVVGGHRECLRGESEPGGVAEGFPEREWAEEISGEQQEQGDGAGRDPDDGGGTAARGCKVQHEGQDQGRDEE